MHPNVGKKTPVALAAALMFTLVGTLLLAGCGGSSAAAAPTPTPTATTIPTATPTPILNSTFASTDGVYTFQFPGDWTQTPLNSSPIVNGVGLKSPDATDFFLTLPLNEGIPISGYSSFFSSFMAGIGTHVVVTPKAQTVKLGANTWTIYDATATVNSNPSMASLFGLTHAGKTFFIVVVAANTNANTVGTTYFLPMVTSMTFLK